MILFSLYFPQVDNATIDFRNRNMMYYVLIVNINQELLYIRKDFTPVFDSSYDLRERTEITFLIDAVVDAQDHL